MVAVHMVGADRVHRFDRSRFEWLVCLLPGSVNERSSMAPAALLSRMSALWHDQKFLRHVEW